MENSIEITGFVWRDAEVNGMTMARRMLRMRFVHAFPTALEVAASAGFGWPDGNTSPRKKSLIDLGRFFMVVPSLSW